MIIEVSVPNQKTLPEPYDGELPLEHLNRCINEAVEAFKGTKFAVHTAYAINAEVDNCLRTWIDQKGYRVPDLPRADCDGHRRQAILESKNRELAERREELLDPDVQYYIGFREISRQEFWNRGALDDIQKQREQNLTQRHMSVNFIDQDGNPYQFDERWNTGFFY